MLAIGLALVSILFSILALAGGALIGLGRADLLAVAVILVALAVVVMLAVAAPYGGKVR